MRTQIFTIAKGNTTLLVWDYSRVEKKKIITKYLPSVEQIGFVTNKNGKPTLEMMGDELCINATLALASTLGPKGVLYTSGAKETVRFINKNNQTQITLSLPYKRFENIVLFPGIGFIVSKSAINNGLLKILTERYKLPAFGSVVTKGNQIIPVVYVWKTNSIIQETACGSGSIAAYLIKGIKRIKQPTGEYITIENTNSSFTVKAKVDKIKIS